MMIAAQRAMMQHGMENRAVVLHRHGIDPDTGKALHPAGDPDPRPPIGTVTRPMTTCTPSSNWRHPETPRQRRARTGPGEIDREHDIRQADRPGQE